MRHLLPLPRPRGETGAASVLVLLVLLLLVFLAVLAFVTTGSNLRLARKNADAIKAWYRMDLQGERTAAKLLQAVRRTAQETEEWLSGNRLLDDGQQVIPPDALMEIRQNWVALETEKDRSAFRHSLFFRVHMILCEQTVERMDLEGMEMIPVDREALFSDLQASEFSGTRFLLHLADPMGQASGTLEAVLEVLPAGQVSETGHLQVLEWKLVQKPFVYNNQIQLWEGNIE